MNLIVWSDALSVKIPSLDAQHQKLVAMINALNEAMLQGKAREVLGGILADLARYTVEHFDFEERLLRKAGYSQLESHQAEHRKMVRQVEQLVRDFENGATNMPVSVLSLLGDWLCHHIQDSDMRYRETLLSSAN